jgi:hypothetical protein
MPTGSAVRRRINRYAAADCARSSSAERPSYCAPMPRSGRRPCPSLGPTAASRRAREPCPAQMLWAPLPLPAVAPNDVLRLASASTAPIARPARPQLRRRAQALRQGPDNRLAGRLAGASMTGVMSTVVQANYEIHSERLRGRAAHSTVDALKMDGSSSTAETTKLVGDAVTSNGGTHEHRGCRGRLC